MANSNLAMMADRDLIRLFSHLGSPLDTRRGKEIIAELERRGFIYDPGLDDFLTCEQWNARYPNAKRNCDKQARG